MLTILFYLKPYWYSFPPSPVPGEDGAGSGGKKKKRKELIEKEKLKRKQQKEEEDIISIIEAMDE